MMGVSKPQRILVLIIACLMPFGVLLAQSDAGAYRMKTVVIDAGHGGQDPGNLGTGRYKKKEKDIALDVALRLGKLITEAYPKLKVLYTRDTDVFIGLNERADVANKADADLFISIHCNAAKNTEAAGVETFTLGLHKNDENLQVAMKENQAIFLEDDYQTKYEGFDPNSPESIIALTIMQSAFLEQSLKISSYIQRQFRDKVSRKDRGVKQAGFLVLRRTTMPSILIELGFLTNKEEEDFLNSDNGRLVMAAAIFQGFKDYKEKVEGGAVVAEPDPKAPKVVEAPVKEAEKPVAQTEAPVKQETKPVPSKADAEKEKADRERAEKEKAEQERMRKQKELEAVKAEKERLERIKQQQEAEAKRKAEEEAVRKAEAQRLAEEKAKMEQELEEARKRAEEKEKQAQAERIQREAVAEQARVEFAQRLAAREQAKLDSTRQIHAEQRARREKELEAARPKPEVKAVVPELAETPLTPEEAELLFLEKRKQELEDRISRIKVAQDSTKTEKKEAPKPVRQEAAAPVTETRPVVNERPTVEKTPAPQTQSGKGVVLSVQIFTSPTPVDVNSARFKGEKVRSYSQDGLYKYVVGEWKSMDEASSQQRRLRQAGFEGAFVVAFQNGNRITVQEARELLSK